MKTNAIPVSEGRCLSNSVKASSPPAEAPTPTTGTSLSSRPRTGDTTAASAPAADLPAGRFLALRFAAVPVFSLAGGAFLVLLGAGAFPFFPVPAGPLPRTSPGVDFSATMIEPSRSRPLRPKVSPHFPCRISPPDANEK